MRPGAVAFTLHRGRKHDGAHPVVPFHSLVLLRHVSFLKHYSSSGVVAAIISLGTWRNL